MNASEFNVVETCECRGSLIGRMLRMIRDTLARVVNTVVAGDPVQPLAIYAGEILAGFYLSGFPPGRTISRIGQTAVKVGCQRQYVVCPVYRDRQLPKDFIVVKSIDRRGLVIIK